MTTTTQSSLRHFTLNLLLHSSNSLTVPRMEIKLGAHVYYIVSMTITPTNSLRRHFSLKLLLPMVARIEVKLGMYAYYIISMTITCFHNDLILFEKASGNFISPHIIWTTTNSLRHLLLHSSNLLTAAHMEIKLGTHAYYIISMMTTSIFL